MYLCVYLDVFFKRWPGFGSKYIYTGAPNLIDGAVKSLATGSMFTVACSDHDFDVNPAVAVITKQAWLLLLVAY